MAAAVVDLLCPTGDSPPLPSLIPPVCSLARTPQNILAMPSRFSPWPAKALVAREAVQPNADKTDETSGRSGVVSRV